MDKITLDTVVPHKSRMEIDINLPFYGKKSDCEYLMMSRDTNGEVSALTLTKWDDVFIAFSLDRHIGKRFDILLWEPIKQFEFDTVKFKFQEFVKTL